MPGFEYVRWSGLSEDIRRLNLINNEREQLRAGSVAFPIWKGTRIHKTAEGEETLSLSYIIVP